MGGGPGGACAASALAGLGVSTILFEAQQEPMRKAGETLAPSAARCLQKLGMWDAFASDGHLRCHGNVSAWGQDRWQNHDFMVQGLGSAWQLDRAVFEESLINAAARAGATIVRGNEVTGISRANGFWRLTSGGRTFRTGYVIDATGRRSTVARKQGVRRIILDRLVAVHGIAACGKADDNDGRTFIESCREGWWYSALVPGQQRIVSLQTDVDLLPRPVWKTREWLLQRLGQTRHLSSLLGRHGYELTAPPRLTSARSGRLRHFGGEGWLAVGDAAMSFDPLSGRGIHNAIQSAMKAAQTLVRDRSGIRAKMECWYERLWEEFSKDRMAYYSLERRWRSAPFWQRRSSG